MGAFFLRGGISRSLVYLRPFDGPWTSRTWRIAPVKNVQERQYSCLFF